MGIFKKKKDTKIVNQIAEYLTNTNAFSEKDNPSLDRQMFKERYFTHCIQSWQSMFYWENLPIGLTNNKLMLELYNKGWLLGYANDIGVPMITPAIPIGLNLLGQPAKFQPIDFTGRRTTEGYRIPSIDCFVLNALQPVTSYGLCCPIRNLDQIYVENIAETFARMQISMVTSTMKFILNAGDTSSVDAFEKQLKSILTADKPYAVIGKSIAENMDAMPFQTGMNAQEYIFLIRNLEQMRTEQLGAVGNVAGEMKAAQQNDTEISQTQMPQMTMYNDNYRRYVEFCISMNKNFGTEMDVKGGLE